MEILLEWKTGFALGIEYMDDEDSFLIVVHLGLINIIFGILNDPPDGTAN